MAGTLERTLSRSQGIAAHFSSKYHRYSDATVVPLAWRRYCIAWLAENSLNVIDTMIVNLFSFRFFFVSCRFTLLSLISFRTQERHKPIEVHHKMLKLSENNFVTVLSYYYGKSLRSTGACVCVRHVSHIDILCPISMKHANPFHWNFFSLLHYFVLSDFNDHFLPLHWSLNHAVAAACKCIETHLLVHLSVHSIQLFTLGAKSWSVKRMFQCYQCNSLLRILHTNIQDALLSVYIFWLMTENV